MAINNIYTDDWDIYTHDDVEESLKEVLQSHETNMAALQGIVSQLQAQAITRESDPTVPSWAKQPTKPTYTAEEVGALPADTPVSGNIENSTTSTDANKALSAAQGYVIRRELEKLLAALSNSAFSTARPVFDWTTPGVTNTYNITRTLSNCTSSNTDNTITEGSTFTTTLSPSNGYTLDGVTPTITMNGNPVSGAWNATSKVITIPDVSGNIAIGCTAVLAQQSYTIGYTLSHCTKSQGSSTSVVEGGSFSAVLIADAGYTLNGVQATGTGFSQVYDNTNDSINIIGVNASGNISIGCTAVTFQVSVSYNLTGFQSETNTQITSGGSFSKTLTPNTGYSVKTIAITMGGANITSSAWNSETKTISIPLVTGDIVITATAEESVAYSVTCNLTGVTKSSGPSEVEEGDSLTVVLSKGDDFNGIHPIDKNQGKVYGFHANEVIVMMGGRVLQNATTQSALDGDVTVHIANVTGEVVITNIVWVEGYIRAANNTVATSVRSVYNTPKITIPDGCIELGLRHNYQDTGYWGIAFYDSSDAFVSGITFTAASSETVTIPGSATSFATSLYNYGWGGDSEPSNAYIKDSTHNEYIWKGEDVQ